MESLYRRKVCYFTLSYNKNYNSYCVDFKNLVYNIANRMQIIPTEFHESNFFFK
jgi:hypothetical protein